MSANQFIRTDSRLIPLSNIAYIEDDENTGGVTIIVKDPFMPVSAPNLTMESIISMLNGDPF